MQAKLRTYKTFKTTLTLEPYLLNDYDRRGRCLFTALRSGTNRLRIETGRWKRPIEPLPDRVCMAAWEAASKMRSILCFTVVHMII